MFAIESTLQLLPSPLILFPLLLLHLHHHHRHLTLPIQHHPHMNAILTLLLHSSPLQIFNAYFTRGAETVSQGAVFGLLPGYSAGVKAVVCQGHEEKLTECQLTPGTRENLERTVVGE